MKSKIVHIIIGLNIGGAELMLKKLVENPSDEFKHIIISLTDEGEIGNELIGNGFDVYCLRLKKNNFLWLGPIRLIRLLKIINPNVVQTWMYHSDFIGGVCAKLLGVNNILWSIRSLDITKGGSKFTIYIRKILVLLSYVIPKKIVCAAKESEKLHIKLGYNKKIMMTIPNGFSNDKFKCDDYNIENIKKELNIKDEFLITSIARFNEIKNHQLFISVCGELIRNIDNNVLFLMVGKDIDHKNEKIMKWINATGAPEKFILLGERKDITDILTFSDIYCLHSFSEGFPNVLCEAMCAGTVCIATDVGDARFILNDNRFIVDSDNHHDLLNKVLYLMSLGEKQLKYIGKKNKERMKSEFMLEKTIEKYNEIYSSFLK